MVWGKASGKNQAGRHSPETVNISFSLTTRQFEVRAKDVTRRLGWNKLRSGQVLTAIEKGQGLKKGEHVNPLGRIVVKSVRRERLARMVERANSYGSSEVIREGFPEMSPAEFVDMFCKHNGCSPETEVTRIEFSYL